MKGRPIFSKNKILVALVALFTMLMCVSVGFATWITIGGSNSSTNGDIQADDFVETTSGEAQCISNTTINSFRYAAGYGFVNETNGRYVSTIDLTGTFTFNVSEAKQAISSIVGSKQFGLKLELTTSITTNFTFTNLTFSGFTNSPVSKTVSSTATACAAYNITLTNDEYSQSTLSCGFSITLTYSGTPSTFPSLASATYNIAITPSEVIS